MRYVILSFLFIGCFPQTRAAKNAMRAELSAIDAQANSAYHSYKCAERQAVRCGPIIRNTDNNQLASELRCDIDSTSCATKVIELKLARLNQALPKINWSWVSEFCTAYPHKCTDDDDFEYIVVTNHNHMVRTWFVTEYMKRTEKWNRRIRQAEIDDKRSNAAILDAMTEPAVKCQTMGGTTTCAQTRVLRGTVQ